MLCLFSKTIPKEAILGVDSGGTPWGVVVMVGDQWTIVRSFRRLHLRRDGTINATCTVVDVRCMVFMYL